MSVLLKFRWSSFLRLISLGINETFLGPDFLGFLETRWRCHRIAPSLILGPIPDSLSKMQFPVAGLLRSPIRDVRAIAKCGRQELGKRESAIEAFIGVVVALKCFWGALMNHSQLVFLPQRNGFRATSVRAHCFRFNLSVSTNRPGRIFCWKCATAASSREFLILGRRIGGSEFSFFCFSCIF